MAMQCPHNSHHRATHLSRRMSILAAEDDKIMFFPSQFVPSLQMLGPKFTSDWLEKRNIDILSKRYVVFPLTLSKTPGRGWDLDTRWMLCVIANPGSILNEFKEEEEQSQDQDIPCFLFRSYRNRTVPRHVIE